MSTSPLSFPRLPTSARPGSLASLVAGALLLPAAHAAETGTPPPGVSMATMVQTFAVLALLLALFVGAAWLMKRLNGGRPLGSSQGPLRIVGALSLGPRERLLLVEIGETWLVVGVSPGQMRTLHTLPKGSLPPAATSGDGQFNQWLRHFREAPRHAQD